MPENHLREQGFCKFVSVGGWYSIAHLIPRRNCCGIYVLRFSDGAYYAGQSVDIAARFSQHRLIHADIEAICWRPELQTNLNEAERSVIAFLEAIPTAIRNVQHTSFPLAQSELETLMSAEGIKRFACDADWNDLTGDRRVDAKLESRSRRRFEYLGQTEHFAPLRLILAQYISRCLPAPWKTEMSHWSLSCFPVGLGGQVVCRINVGWQEVFTVWDEADHWFVYMQARKSLIGKSWREFMSFRRQHCPMYRNAYKAGGSDQLRVEGAYFDSTMALLADPKFVLAVRHLNLTLASKSGSMWSRSHCPQLVEAAFSLR
jgi:hypothetical protein